MPNIDPAANTVVHLSTQADDLSHVDPTLFRDRQNLTVILGKVGELTCVGVQQVNPDICAVLLALKSKPQSPVPFEIGAETKKVYLIHERDATEREVGKFQKNTGSHHQASLRTLEILYVWEHEVGQLIVQGSGIKATHAVI